MTNIRKNLMVQEQILFQTRKHLILFFWPAVILVLGVMTWQYINTVPMLAAKISWVPPLVVVLVWVKFLIEYYCSEFVVTNRRVWMREGFFLRQTHETRLQAIAQINVDQSILGQILGYGRISIQSFGATGAVFDLIASPFQFQHYVNKAIQGLESK